MPAMLVLLWCSVASAQTTQTWEYTGGKWTQVAGASNATTRSADSATLDRVAELIVGNKNQEAFKLDVKWLLAHKTDPQRDRALFMAARALYQYGDRIKAYYYLDELMDECPDSHLFAQALELQYDIANAYLEGYKRRFCGVPMFHAYEEAIEMLFRIQQRSPGSPLAEKALLRTANWYYNDRQYDFAADTYATYIRTYPRSPDIPRIKLRRAYATYAQFRGPKFDATPVIDAREQLREIVFMYPELAAEENIPSMLEQLDRNLARKLYWTGDFYRRTNDPRGAAYTFKYLAKAYTNTDEAEQAKVALSKLPQWAVASVPDPAIAPAYTPGVISPSRLPPQPQQKTIFK